MMPDDAWLRPMMERSVQWETGAWNNIIDPHHKRPDRDREGWLHRVWEKWWLWQVLKKQTHTHRFTLVKHNHPHMPMENEKNELRPESGVRAKSLNLRAPEWAWGFGLFFFFLAFFHLWFYARIVEQIDGDWYRRQVGCDAFIFVWGLKFYVLRNWLRLIVSLSFIKSSHLKDFNLKKREINPFSNIFLF